MKNDAQQYAADLESVYCGIYYSLPYLRQSEVSRESGKFFDELSFVEGKDGQSYVVGIVRDKIDNYTADGDKTPHALSQCWIFSAQLKNNRLTDRGVRLRAVSEESFQYTDNYRRDFPSKSIETLINEQPAKTLIFMDINEDEKVRRRRNSDTKYSEWTTPDFEMEIPQFYNVADRHELLKAVQMPSISAVQHIYADNNGKNSDKWVVISKVHMDVNDERYVGKDFYGYSSGNYKKIHEKIAAICAEIVFPNENDVQCRLIEKKRLQNKEKNAETATRIRKRAALRQFVKREKNKGINVLHCGSLYARTRKAIAARMVPIIIKKMEQSKREKLAEQIQLNRSWKSRDVA